MCGTRLVLYCYCAVVARQAFDLDLVHTKSGASCIVTRHACAPYGMPEGLHMTQLQLIRAIASIAAVALALCACAAVLPGLGGNPYRRFASPRSLRALARCCAQGDCPCKPFPSAPRTVVGNWAGFALLFRHGFAYHAVTDFPYFLGAPCLVMMLCSISGITSTI